VAVTGSPDILLSILVGTTTRRTNQCANLVDYLNQQVQMWNRPDVEILWLGDNLRCTAGMKRERLLRIARGKFLSYCDDDDTVAPNYVGRLAEACGQHDVDVITFRQLCEIDATSAYVTFHAGHKEIEPWTGKDITRPPYHVCCWRTALAQTASFADCNYGEDVFWLQQLWPKVKTSHHIDEVLHTYRWSSAATLCQPGT
jgi:hypothetical protein